MLSDLQRVSLTQYFRVYDIDADGHIGPKDFARVVENVRQTRGLDDGSPEHRELRAAYRRWWEALRLSADVDHNGEVEIQEWLVYWAGVLDSKERYDAEVATIVKLLLEIFDTDGDGVLEKEELEELFGAYGLSIDLADHVFESLDADGNLELTHEELMEAGSQFYRGNNPNAPWVRLFGP